MYLRIVNDEASPTNHLLTLEPGQEAVVTIGHADDEDDDDDTHLDLEDGPAREPLSREAVAHQLYRMCVGTDVWPALNEITRDVYRGQAARLLQVCDVYPKE